ncbi:MAG: hypothetical protein LH473_06435, partial [Chitinophagales bacterium]|nr:hypothetical protein [Chitinophagales bacterium]
AEDSVNVNLELDPALDARSVTVVEAGIGNSFHITNTNSAVSKVNDYQFNFSTATRDPRGSNKHFQYSINTNRSNVTCSGSVIPNVTFRFGGINLKGIHFPQVDETMGYVKFKVNAVRPYSSIHNRAGIYFSGQGELDSMGSLIEVITNLATTTCNHEVSPSDSTSSSELDACENELKQCKSDCHDWKYWLGWSIAGIEFLLLIFLLTRKKK